MDKPNNVRHLNPDVYENEIITPFMRTILDAVEHEFGEPITLTLNEVSRMVIRGEIPDTGWSRASLRHTNLDTDTVTEHLFLQWEDFDNETSASVFSSIVWENGADTVEMTILSRCENSGSDSHENCRVCGAVDRKIIKLDEITSEYPAGLAAFQSLLLR